MRALVTTDTVGGVWTYSLDLARGLRALGVDVVLATMGDPLRGDQRREAAAVEPAVLYESSYALEWMSEPWADVDAAGEWLCEIAESECVDIVHSCSFSHGALDWGRPVVVVAHSCVPSWWRAVEGSAAPPEWDEYRRRVGAGLVAADAVIAPTSAMLESLAVEYGFRSGLVVENGSTAAESDLAKEPFVLASGRLWDRAKGLDILDAAVAELDWPVLAAGDGASTRHLRLMGRLGRDELRGLCERAGIFAAPVRYEPFGLGIVEAARASCPLVLGDTASLRELWSEAAVFVEPNDPASLRGELERLIADPHERRRLGRAARMRSRRFSVERMARAYAALYARLLGSGDGHIVGAMGAVA